MNADQEQIHHGDTEARRKPFLISVISVINGEICFSDHPISISVISVYQW